MLILWCQSRQNFPSITEGQNVGFEISATTTSTVPRFIPVDIKNTSGNFLSESESTTFHLNANERTAFLSIPTFDNIYFETNGGITAEIHRGDGYTIAESPNNVATVAVLDNDAPTGLSIIELNDMIAEGEVARFQITAHNAEPVDRIIELQVSDNGGYINGTIPTSITLPAANTRYILEFQTLDNSLDAPSGEIIATIEPSTEYYVAAEPNNSASVYVQDRVRPTLSITSGLQVLEGENAEFTITASQLSADLLNINLEVTESEDFFSISPEEVAILAAGELEVTYSIPIKDNNLDSLDSQLTVKLLDGLNYAIDSTGDVETTMTIMDNDQPAISIIAIDTSVVEGENARFELRSSTPTDIDLPVTFNITPNNDNFIAQSIATRTEVIAVG